HGAPQAGRAKAFVRSRESGVACPDVRAAWVSVPASTRLARGRRFVRRLLAPDRGRAASGSLPQPSRLDPPWSPAEWHAGEPVDGPGNGRACFLLRLPFSCQIGVATHGVGL